MKNQDFSELERLNLSIKIETTKALMDLGYGHFGGCLSITEVLACLYGRYLSYDPLNPNRYDRDRFVLSKGHAGPALYATLALQGFFSLKDLKDLNKNGSFLPSHVDMNRTPGIDMSTGSLGQGLSCAIGMALGSENHVYAIVGDGELQEGQCWEAIQFVAHNKIGNLTIFVDNNKKQLDGTLEEIQYPFNLQQKFSSFGINCLIVDGADVKSICHAIDKALIKTNETNAIILDTVKGQGIEHVEKCYANHHLRLTEESRADILRGVQKLEEQRRCLA